MFGDENDTRFWIFHTTIGKWIIRLFIVGVIIAVILEKLGYIE